MLINSPDEGQKAAEQVGDLKLIQIKILDMPADTILLSVEHRRYKLMPWVQILASVRFIIFPLCSFFSATLAMRWKVQF